eukprot:TRINITY_DN8651_c0_g1_i1.p1 TRINITY_DN8651_c0_g1~~TRINITY_DN8651_c0_g1_i1.p1  ORF type:complete len:1419 (-),score=222.67 TRINITY_DN8651_c0_g1_i1:288-4544(-)
MENDEVNMMALRRIKCILCHQVILMPDLPPSKYINHLMSTHDIIFDIEFLINRTLLQQYPELAQPEPCSCKGKEISANDAKITNQQAESNVHKKQISMQESASKLQEIFPPSVSITPVLKRKGSEEKVEAKRIKSNQDVVQVNGITIIEETSITPKECEPSWSLGCLYRCQICSVKFQTLSSFKSHLFFHKVTVDDYIKQHGDPGVKFQHHICIKCSQMVQQDPFYLKEHLATHDLTLAAYTQLFEAQMNDQIENGHLNEKDSHADADVASTMSSTSKSSPGAPSDFRKSVDNLSETSSSSNMQDDLKIKECTVNLTPIDNQPIEASDENSSEDGMNMFDVINIKTEPDIEIGYFGNNEFDMSRFNGSDLEMSITQNIIRDLTKTAESFFQNQAMQFQEQHHFPVQSAGRIPWYHGCLYQCAIANCKRQFFEKVFLKSHVDTQHEGINFDQYAIEYGNANTIIHYHECEICGKGIVHTARNIENHLVGQHSVTLSQYYEEFKQSINIVNLEITDETLLIIPPDQSMIEDTKPLKFPGENLNMQNRSVDWADRCIYECKECSPPETFDTHSKVSYHVKKKHCMAMKDYTTKFGRAMIYEEKHTCQICGSHVLWERSSIYQHIYQVHNRMTMEEYGRLMTSYKDAPAEPVQKMTRQMSYVESNIDWTNECVFECKLCQPTRKFNSKNKISFHVKRMHSLKMTEYNSMYGTSLLSRSWHTCQICGISILCDYFSLYQHVTKGHKVSLNDYQDQLMTNYDAERIEWLNRCIFGCKICKAEFSFRSDFTSHIETVHNISMNTYRKDNGSVFKHKEIHICQIKSCGKKFCWETLSLKAHIEKKHEMQAIEYYERFMANYAEKSPTSEANRKGSGVEPVDSRINQCEYQCHLCDEIFDVDRYFSEHLKNTHHITKNDYKASFGLGLSKKVAQNCQLCKANPKEFLMDQAYLGVHIRITHKSSINSYLQKIEAAHEIPEDIKDTEDWCYQCRFICCETVFRQKWKFDRHISASHGILVSEFFEQNRHSPGYFLRKMYHTCKVCSKEIVCDKGPMQSHVRTHDLSLDGYYQNFVLSSIKPPSDWLNIAIHKNVIHTCQVCHQNIPWNSDKITAHLATHNLTADLYKQHCMTAYKFNKAATAHMSDDSNWSDKNKWECKVEGCRVPLASRVKLVLHIQRVHTLTALEYFRAHKDSLQTDKQHTCQLCCANILWDSYYLREHLRIKHKMKMVTYKNRFIANYNADITADEARTKRKKFPGKIAKKKIEHKPTKKIFSQSDAEIWATGCLFSCQMCNPATPIAGHDEFTSHLIKTHNTPFYKYAKQFQDYKLVSGFHFCKICQKNVKWDIDPLTKHFEDIHKLSLEEYYEEHKPKMPKLLNGAAEASKEMNDADNIKKEDFENIDNTEKTGENIMISDVQSISAVIGTKV